MTVILVTALCCRFKMLVARLFQCTKLVTNISNRSSKQKKRHHLSSISVNNIDVTSKLFIFLFNKMSTLFFQKSSEFAKEQILKLIYRRVNLGLIQVWDLSLEVYFHNTLQHMSHLYIYDRQMIRKQKITAIYQLSCELIWQHIQPVSLMSLQGSRPDFSRNRIDSNFTFILTLVFLRL